MLYDLIYNAYLDKPIYKKQNHLLIRCPYCGDSIKNINHAHLYIEPDKKVFWCARCYIGGSLSYLLYTIKDRLNNIYYNTLIELAKSDNKYKSINKANNNIYNDQYLTILNKKSKLAIKTNKEIEIIQNYLIDKFSIYLEHQYIDKLPLFIGTKINMNNYLCWFTLSNSLILCRSMIKSRDFKTIKIDNNLNDDNNNRCTLFSFKTFKLESKNILPKKKTFIIAEGLTDILYYAINNDLLNAELTYFISTNGKYKDDLNYIIDNIANKNHDNFIFLIDKDAIKYETEFIKNLDINNKTIIYPVDNNDYRTAKIYEKITIKKD